ncbi:MAG TPA: hypothetical protein VGK80_08135 [Rhodanobacteraceae bacterium]
MPRVPQIESAGEGHSAVPEILRKYGIDTFALLCAVALTWFTLKLG